MNSIIIEYGGINIQRNGINIRIPYKELVNMNINNESNIFGFNDETLKIFKEFSNYMIDRLEDIDIDPEKPITISWSDEIQNNMEQLFATNIYEEILRILKQEVEKSLKYDLDENREGDSDNADL
jgi:hypothetical protein